MAAQILIIDDERGVRESLRMVLEYEGFQVSTAASAGQGLDQATKSAADLIFLDIRMPDMSGLELLGCLKKAGVPAPVIVISGHGTISTAVQATKLGAFDFMEKPLGTDQVLLGVKNALRQRRLELEVEKLSGRSSCIIGESQAMQKVRADIRRAAPTQATVLITGESGTGKELVAMALHRASQRHDKEFIRVNCAAIPEDLIESELFGHERGSFTGAARRQKGKFSQADGGTLFLDEVGDMSLRTQSKVLRVLQDGEVEPVGAGRSHKVDVRILAATNKSLSDEIRAGRFREDLFFRLNVLPIHLPPLRQRQEDIPALTLSFISRWCEANGRRRPDLSSEVLAVFSGHRWKGNVRELQNAVERFLILGPSDPPDPSLLRRMLSLSSPDEGVSMQSQKPDPSQAKTLKEFREVAERRFLVERLAAHDWNIAATARAIETPRSNLYKKLEAYGIHRETEGSS